MRSVVYAIGGVAACGPHFLSQVAQGLAELQWCSHTSIAKRTHGVHPSEEFADVIMSLVECGHAMCTVARLEVGATMNDIVMLDLRNGEQRYCTACCRMHVANKSQVAS
jgi:hypothetical protein